MTILPNLLLASWEDPKILDTIKECARDCCHVHLVKFHKFANTRPRLGIPLKQLHRAFDFTRKHDIISIKKGDILPSAHAECPYFSGRMGPPLFG